MEEENGVPSRERAKYISDERRISENERRYLLVCNLIKAAMTPKRLEEVKFEEDPTKQEKPCVTVGVNFERTFQFEQILTQRLEEKLGWLVTMREPETEEEITNYHFMIELR